MRKTCGVWRVFAVVALGLALWGCACGQKNIVDRTDRQIIVDYPEAVSDEPPIEKPTLPPPDAQRLLRLAVIADMNSRYGSTEYAPEVVRAIDIIVAERPDIVINAGDMVAGQRAKLRYRDMWKAFHSIVTDRLVEAGIPMAQTVGNHDGSGYTPFANEREIYIDEWLQRKPALDYVDDSAYPLYYSFLQNGLFFVALDASTLDALSQEQFSWLERQLANNPTPYGPIVFGHVPLFPVTAVKPEVVRDARLHPLFAKHGVQLVISGHHHAYFPAVLDGVTYLHVGVLGGGPRPVRQNGGVEPKTFSFVNLYANASPTVDTFLMDGTSHTPFNHNLLPTYIVHGPTLLPRIDIAMEDARFAYEYMISPHMTRSQMLTLIEALRASQGDWSRVSEWSLAE
ncbi:MAG: metallophosphoesterase [Proteobacteria bacterium]|nr:metallophosphoesterase [Pseudomonadota bacterium]